MDFTLDIFFKLLTNLKNAGYTFQTFEQYITAPQPKVIILRHDVDLLPLNSLRTAQMENQLGICGSYYFRIVKESFNPEIIKQIADLGHEIGYHYETMDTCHGDIDEAYQEFCKNLDVFRNIQPITTVCMHGSPLSKYDNRDMWKKYDYKKLDLIGEPYFDLNFSKMLYLTDTGRCWDGSKISVRDKVKSNGETSNSDLYNFHSTSDIIKALNENKLPDQIMINVHPQRWTNNVFAWIKELILQTLKNQVKRVLVSSNSKKNAN
jgi:hypothetical protein